MPLFTPHRETFLYRVNPAFKFSLFIAMLLVALFNRNFSFAVYQFIAYTLLLYLFSGFRIGKLLLFTAPFVIVFISSASTMILFGKGDSVIWSWGLIRISEESINRGLLLGFKTLSFGSIGLLFALTTKPVLLFYSLMQQFRLPPKYAYSFIASIRMFPSVLEDFKTRTDALKVRGAKFPSGVKGMYSRLRAYAIPLLAQSIRRAQRVAVAMEAKRFLIGADRTYYYPTAYGRIDGIFFLFMTACVIASYVLAVYAPLYIFGQ